MYWFMSNLFFTHLKLSTDYQSMKALVHLFIISTIWIPCLNWVIPLIHLHKIQKHFYLKLPSTSGLQPQRVSWSDNRGAGSRPSLFMAWPSLVRRDTWVLRLTPSEGSIKFYYFNVVIVNFVSLVLIFRLNFYFTI